MRYIIGLIVLLLVVLYILYALIDFVNVWKPTISSDIPSLLKSHQFYPIKEPFTLRYFDNGKSLFEDMIEEINNAKKQITFSMYSVKRSIYSDILFKALSDAKKRGIHVVVILDSIGSSVFKSLGINAIKYNKFSLVRKNKYLSYRSHDKYLMIDDTLLYLSSFVIRKSSIESWLESGLKITSHFEETLNKRFIDEIVEESYALNKICIPFWSSSKHNYALYADVYLNTILNSKKYIYIFNPYFVPPRQIIDALVKQANSYVDIHIIVLSKGDHPIINFDAKYILKEMILNANPTYFHVYVYPHTHLHSKIMLADDDIVVFGSGNLDYRSLFQMHETGAFIRDKTLHDEIQRHFEKVIGESRLLSTKGHSKVISELGQNTFFKTLL